ncbi:MAG: hypothetical protein JWQ64_2588 [Subtercola sp.]|nr:hypothetical protein [Subtercola sp.]
MSARRRRSAADALRALVRPPRRQSTILVLVGAAVGSAACWYFGLDVWRAVGFGVIGAAAGLTWVAVPDHSFTEWTLPGDSSRDGARRDVVQLSWALRSRYGRIGHTAFSRVRDVAATRLALRGLDLTDPADQPAIERLIGGRAYATLRSGSRLRLPRMRAFVHCLDALDALDARDAPDPRTSHTSHTSATSATPNTPHTPHHPATSSTVRQNPRRATDSTRPAQENS